MGPDAIQDLFQELGPIRTRRMFGGQGIYLHDRMFALEAGGEIYLKTDGVSVERFKAAGSRAFSFEKDGKPQSTSYWLLPSSAADDPGEAALWGRLAIDAATRAAAAKTPKGRR